MIVREKSKQMLYVGADPNGKAGIIRKTIGEFTQTELRGWYNTDPLAVANLVIFTPEKKVYEPSKEAESGGSQSEQA